MKAFVIEHVHVVVLAIGVALAAAGGARLGNHDFSVTATLGKAQLTGYEGEIRTEVLSPGERLSNWADEGIVSFGAGLVLIVAGSVMTRRRHHHERRAASDHSTSVDFSAELPRLASRVEAIEADLAAESPDTARIRDAIEQLQVETLDRLFEQRAVLELRFGLGGFAAVIGPLAGAERFLNRTWTTLVDHHVDEARASLAQAREAIAEAMRAADGLETN